MTDQDIKEHMGLGKADVQDTIDMSAQLPEAPASVTYTIETGTGFNCLFTVREMSGLALLNKMPAIESKFAELGIKPQVKRSFGGPKPAPKVVEGRKCSKCDADVVEGRTKAGKVFHKCSTQKYDFATKQTSGCDWIDWEP